VDLVGSGAAQTSARTDWIGQTLSGFEKATGVTALGDGRFEMNIDPGWFGVGPNGGVLAATMLRALTAHIDDAARHPLSLTCHFLRPLVAGAAVVSVSTERIGRGVTALSARIEQGETTGVLALSTFGVEREGLIDYETPAPDVPPPAEVERAPIPARRLAIFDKLEYRPCIGSGPFSSSAEALVGGWSRLGDHEPLDDAALALLSDAWPPSSWARLDGPAWAPTIDLTVHFRSRIPSGAEWALVRMCSTTSKRGFWEEDGEIWSLDGVLLAHSRQLALLRPVSSR
jgi:acyl-CoA thioesterase